MVVQEIEKLIETEEYGKAKLELRKFMRVLEGIDYALSAAIRRK